MDGYCLTMLFDYVNARHQSIRFTIEKEIDKKLSFLNIFRQKLSIHTLKQYQP